MKLKLIILLITSLFVSFNVLAVKKIDIGVPSLSYVLIPHPEAQSPYLEINMTLPGEKSGKTLIAIPSQWGGVDYTDQIKNLSVRSKTAKISDGQKPNVKIISHKPSEILHLSYKIIPMKRDNTNLVHQVILWKELYHIVGVGAFITPIFSDETKNTSIWNTDKVHFSIQWKDLPKNWNTASSYGLGNNVEFRGTINDLFALFIAGETRLFTFHVQDKPVHISLYGNFNFTNDEKLLKELKTVITSQRDFFKDYDFPDYLVSMIESPDPFSASGTGFKNAFSMHYHKDYTIPNSPKDPLMGFAHEHMHVWIGHKIHGKEEDEGLNYWWSEGFTDYYSRLLLVRSKLLSEEEFIKETNTMLERYFLSPVINVPNAKIKEDFWKSSDIQDLAHSRGFVFALLLDGLIRKDTGNKQSLDNLMHDLFQITRESREPFTNELLEKLTLKYIPSGIEHQLNSFIIKGDTIDLHPIFNELPIKIEKMVRYELGFSLESLLNKKIIEDINIQSNAYKAGLRNGQKVEKRDLIKIGDPNQTLTFTIDGKDIKFQPVIIKALEVPQLLGDTKAHIEEIKQWFFVS